MQEISDLVRTLLSRRGISAPHAISEFLNPDYDLHAHAPQLLEGMDRALERLFAAIERGERIAVYADFDCDGIPGAAILADFFSKIGYSNVETYIPHRDREGYGLHVEALATLAGHGVKLVITVDLGTVAVAAVGYAKQLGIDVIVTDHHELSGPLPDAVAILNPKIGAYPFRDLCGAAVAFKLVQAALAEGERRSLPKFAQIPAGWEKWLLDLVAIATIADMVPLVGENRTLTLFGLKVLRKSPRFGIRALCAQLRLRQSELTEDDVSFSIAPRINAASRMDSPDIALRLLTTTDPKEADSLARELEALNRERKGVVGSVVKQVRKSVAARYIESDRVVVVGNPEWKPALLGLAANSIVGERGGVVCLWGRDGSGRLKGSCRSDGSVSVVDLFTNARDAFEECGGHKASGGFSVSHDSVHTLPDVLARAAEGVQQSAVDEKPTPDWLLTLPEISQSLYREVSMLAPFGVGNPKPMFQISDALVTSMRRFGKEMAHLELSLESKKSGTRARAFDFFRGPEDFSHAPQEGVGARILASIERDSFRGGLALRLVDITA